MNPAPLLEAIGLSRHFTVRRHPFARVSGTVRAVDAVDFSIAPRETLGLIGESGCGKSTIARLAVRLIAPSAGQLRFNGEDFLALRGAALRRRRADIQMVFQDPAGALDPRHTAGQIVAEPLEIHGIGPARVRRERAAALLARVGPRPEQLGRYPHEFSGGQRQRIGIARALALQPRLLVCDEAVSALDVPVQAQVVNPLKRLQRDLGLAYLFIAHDLSVVRHISDRVAVMHMGRIVETAPVEALFGTPHHPYTQSLLSAGPRHRPGDQRARIILAGEVPNPLAPPACCRFHPRCPLALVNIGHAGILAAGSTCTMPEAEDLRLLHVCACAAALRRHRPHTVGVKVRVGRSSTGTLGAAALHMAIRAAEEAAGSSAFVPVMVHVGADMPPTIEEILDPLRPGDLLTHCCSPKSNSVLAPDGSLRASARAARDRGVLFDIAHGQGSFGFATARRMLELGVVPDVISSDVHSGCVDGPAFDVLVTMSKMLALGMPLPEVVRRATATPAAAIARPDLGTLVEGGIGDATVLEVLDAPTTLADSIGTRLEATRRLACRGAVVGGRLAGGRCAARPQLRRPGASWPVRPTYSV
jgi:oligopeptide/dipeptide ABC transporter ATP-binding protein